MLKSERQDCILREVLQRGSAAVVDLAGWLNVSEITIRRDLDELDRGGHLQRIHGGARRRSPRGPEPPVVQRQLLCSPERQAIALVAAELALDGDVIALESGSTTLELARAIARRPWQCLQVVTNSFPIAGELMGCYGVQIVFIGGIVNRDEMGTFGVPAQDMLRRLSIHKLFLGCRGIDPHLGLSNSIQAEMETATVRALTAASDQVFVLADHSKFGHTFLFQVLPITDIDIIITDSQTPHSVLDELQRRGPRVIVAPGREPTPAVGCGSGCDATGAESSSRR